MFLATYPWPVDGTCIPTARSPFCCTVLILAFRRVSARSWPSLSLFVFAPYLANKSFDDTVQRLCFLLLCWHCISSLESSHLSRRIIHHVDPRPRSHSSQTHFFLDRCLLIASGCYTSRPTYQRRGGLATWTESLEQQYMY